MNAESRQILANLDAVAAERRARAADGGLQRAVQSIKTYQHERFRRTYADLMAGGRYVRASEFFLNDLYGPEDYTQRDDQFARVVPAIGRLFPHEILVTVLALSELHALSERLDSAMGRAHGSAVTVSDGSYAAAWRQVGQPAERERQIVLMLDVGRALDRYTRSALLRHSLRADAWPGARGGARGLAGLPGAGF